MADTHTVPEAITCDKDHSCHESDAIMIFGERTDASLCTSGALYTQSAENGTLKTGRYQQFQVMFRDN